MSDLSVMLISRRSAVEISFLQDGILLLLETASSPVALKCEKNVPDYGSQRRKV